MSQTNTLPRTFGIAVLVTMLGAASSTIVYAQTASTSSAAQSGNSAMSSSDQKMMHDIAYANLSEIEAGKLAQSKSQNEQVKNFAQRMIDDHTKAQQELQQLADAKGVKLPAEPDAKHKAEAQKLQAMSGAQFDKKYMEQGGLSDHRKTHGLLARVETHAADADLKALAAKMLPTVDQHLHMAQQEISRAKSSASGSSQGTQSRGASGTSNTTPK